MWRDAPDDGGWAAPPAVHDGTVYVSERAKSGVRDLEADTGEEVCRLRT
jgi:outer membrane protein assembly factor BamB